MIRDEDVLEAVVEEGLIRPDLFLYALEPADRLRDPIVVERTDQELVLLVVPRPLDVDGEVQLRPGSHTRQGTCNRDTVDDRVSL